MFQRGDGMGLEITTTVVRGVRLDAADPGRVADVAEVPVGSFDDHDSIFDALVRLRGHLGPSALPTRVGWFPAGSGLQRLDVTGRTGIELNEIRQEMSDRLDITSTMLVDAGARRWMLALHWDHAMAWRLEELVERAGFVDVAVEPAPVALQRVVAADVTVARRDASSGRAWAAVYGDGIPLAAASVDIGGREYPGVSLSRAPIGLHRLDELVTLDDLGDEVARLTGALLDPTARAGELEVGLRVAGEPYPPFPAHDLRAPQRVAVALGAAAGAAGLTGRLRPVDVTALRVDSDAVERPWAVERVTDVSAGVERTRVPWWHRGWRRVARN